MAHSLSIVQMVCPGPFSTSGVMPGCSARLTSQESLPLTTAGIPRILPPLSLPRIRAPHRNATSVLPSPTLLRAPCWSSSSVTAPAPSPLFLSTNKSTRQALQSRSHTPLISSPPPLWRSSALRPPTGTSPAQYETLSPWPSRFLRAKIHVPTLHETFHTS